MKSSVPIISPRRRAHAQGAFSLMELLVVLAIVAILSALVVQSIGALQDSGNITTAAYNLTGILENARAYAMANNTYTWVGFYEEAPNALMATSAVVAQPPYTQANANVGQVRIGVMASLDGTRNFSTPANLVAVQKLTLIRNVHITNLTLLANNLNGNLAHRTTADSYLDCESPTLNSSGSDFPVILHYPFYKTICFSPRGEALLDTPTSTSSTTFSLQHLIEIGLVPTHGGIVNKNSPNLVAIQISGLGGVVKIYRP